MPLLALLCLVLAGCSPPPRPADTAPGPPQRIVSLAPSNTELLFALGLGDRIAAVTSACDYPPGARQKPNIGGAYNPSLEKITALRPDLVVGLRSVNAKLLASLESRDLRVLPLDARNVEGVYADLLRLGRETGAEAEARKAVGAMRARMAAVEAAVKDAPRKPRVLVLHSLNPVYTTGPGSFITDVVRAAGGESVPDRPVPGDRLSPEGVIGLRPDVIVCGPELAAQCRRVPGWARAVPAVRDGRFFSPSGDAELTRPTPRLAAAAEQMAHYLHPERFRP